MLFASLSLILILGVVCSYLFKKIHLPALIGYLLIGIFLNYFSLIDSSILNISAEIRKIALAIILIKAGLSLDLKKLKEVGRPALLLSFLPAVFEMVAVGLIGSFILNISMVESFLLGSVLGAVSPAVVVPRMTKMIDDNVGCEKGIPQMIIAGCSMDDIVMIVAYTSLLTLQGGGEVGYMTFLNVPISIVTGVAVGIGLGFVLSLIFKHLHLRDSLKLALILGVSFGMLFCENFISQYFGFSSLLCIISLSMTIFAMRKEQGQRLAKRCEKMWVVAEVFLFVLVGASLNLSNVPSLILPGLGLICCGLFFRIIGTYLATFKTPLNFKQRTFVTISYLPKATVQAAIGGGLLDLGNKLADTAMIAAGQIVLTVSVISILFTAPLGAMAMDLSVKSLVNSD